MASEIETSSSGRSPTTWWVTASVMRKYSPNPPGASAAWPITRMPSGPNSVGMELTREPMANRRSVSGP